ELALLILISHGNTASARGALDAGHTSVDGDLIHGVEHVRFVSPGWPITQPFEEQVMSKARQRQLTKVCLERDLLRGRPAPLAQRGLELELRFPGEAFRIFDPIRELARQDVREESAGQLERISDVDDALSAPVLSEVHGPDSQRIPIARC